MALERPLFHAEADFQHALAWKIHETYPECGESHSQGRAVFNIAGSKYRIVVWIYSPYRVVYIRFIGTHRHCDRIDAQTV